MAYEKPNTPSQVAPVARTEPNLTGVYNRSVNEPYVKPTVVTPEGTTVVATTVDPDLLPEIHKGGRITQRQVDELNARVDNVFASTAEVDNLKSAIASLTVGSPASKEQLAALDVGFKTTK